MERMVDFPMEGCLRKYNQNPISKLSQRISSKIKDSLLFGGFAGHAKLTTTGSLKLPAASQILVSIVS
jgi:hypothetical protein